MSISQIKMPTCPRISARLDEIVQYPLSVICTPIGFGKTAALREYLDRTKLQSVWLSLLDTEGSAAYIWQRLSSQINKYDAKLGEHLTRLGFPADHAQMAHIVELFGSYPYSRPTVVVLDGYHLIDEPPLSTLITRLAVEEIHNLHLVLLAQDISVLPVVDLEQRQLCLMLGRDVFQLTREEVYEYSVFCGYPLSERTLQKMMKITGGWARGVYLSMRDLQDGQPIGQQSEIIAVMESYGYSNYNQELRSFLCKLSFLDEFTAAQAVYILGEPDATVYLPRLLRSNAFITCDQATGVYRMMPVFRELLQLKASQLGVDHVGICRSAGYWHLEYGERVQGYEYLRRAGDEISILRDLSNEEMDDMSYLQHGQIGRILNGMMSEESFMKYPLATLRYQRVRTLLGDNATRIECGKVLARMEEYYLKADMPERERSRILGELHFQWALQSFNNARDVIEHADKAARWLDGRQSCFIRANTRFMLGAASLLYSYYSEPGGLRETVKFISENFHKMEAGAEGRGAGTEPLILAEYALETGRLGDVTLHAQKAILRAERFRQTSIEICAVFTMARAAALEGRFSDALSMMDGLAERVTGASDAMLDTTLDLCRAYIDSCAGRDEALVGRAFYGDMDANSFMRPGTSLCYIVCCRAALLSGSFLRLEVLCEEFHEKYSVYHNQLGFLHNGIYQAVAKHRLYSIHAAQEVMARALDLAGMDGVIAPFMETAEYVLPLLHQAVPTEHCTRAFLDELIARCEVCKKRILDKRPHAAVLTAREREVLSMLALGMRHEDIAARLFISVPTVRYHVKNIYLKLEVNNKVSAVERGKQLEMI